MEENKRKLYKRKNCNCSCFTKFGIEGLACAIIFNAAKDYKQLKEAEVKGITHIYLRTCYTLVNVKSELASIEQFVNEDCFGYIENGREIFNNFLQKKYV